MDTTATVTKPRTITYRLPYMVIADSRLEAITKAGELLRTTVRVLELVEAEQGVPGWYDVTFLVEETL